LWGRDDDDDDDGHVDRASIEAAIDDLDEDELREEAVDVATEKERLRRRVEDLETERERLSDRVEDLNDEVERYEDLDQMEVVDEFEDVFDEDAVDLKPPHMRTSTFGVVEDVFREWRHRQMEKKLARKGYVKWYLVRGNTLTRPKYVKPEATGGGIPRYEYDGTTYLFHEDAMVADESNAIWTCFHKENETDPIPVRDPLRQGIPTDTVDEWLTLEVATESPEGGLFGMDLDRGELIRYGGMAFIAAVFIQRLMANGVV
jgi:hypothetical protein